MTKKNVSEMKMIDLELITPDANQPRKSFDETSLNELAESIKEKGVLQPILVRPSLGTTAYLLVCGERRFRASKLAGIKAIPCVIKDLTDEESLELQIIENLQRADVHPMEEAMAFFELNKTMDFKSIALKVAKDVRFVKQRVSLALLTESWQRVFLRNLIPTGIALKLSTLSVESQNDMFEDKVGDADDEAKCTKINFWDNDFINAEADLTKVKFDLDSLNYHPTASACNTCNSNSAVSDLFADGKKVCSNLACFKIKNTTFFSAEIELAKDDENICFILGYHESGNEELKIQLLSENFVVVEKYNNEFSSINEPELEDETEFRKDYEDRYFDEDEFEDELVDVDTAWQNKVAEYNDELQEYNDAIATGEYRKALVVSGPERGQYLYIQLIEKGGDKSQISLLSAEDEALAKIDARETRNKELDNEKIYNATMPELKGPFTDCDIPLKNEEYVVLATLLMDNSYTVREFVRRLPDYKQNDDAMLEDLRTGKLDFSFVSRMIRIAAYDKLVSKGCANYEKFSYPKVMFDVAKLYIPEIVADKVAIQKEASDKRQANMMKRRNLITDAIAAKAKMAEMVAELHKESKAEVAIEAPVKIKKDKKAKAA